MYSAWSKHLSDPETKVHFERTVRAAKPVLDRLQVLIEEKETEQDRTEIDVTVFDKPNWSERQAYYNGARSAYNTIYRLINLDQQKDTL